MRDLIQQVRVAADSRSYYLALFASLALPDICGALGAPDGQASRARYVAWFDRHVAPRYAPSFGARSFLTGEDAYYYRCSVLHQGSSQHPKSSYSRILFLEPGATGVLLHNNVMNDALNIDVGRFCHDILDGVEEWLEGAEADPTYKKNSSQFLRRFPEGLAPYIVGVPVIA
jgi:hypothetical protein